MKHKQLFTQAGIWFAIFCVFTVMVRTVDVQPIGPKGSKVGFAGLNAWAQGVIGTSDGWYMVSKLIGGVALLVAAGFALIGLVQLVQHKSLSQVDEDIIWLGVLYALVIIFYVLFNNVVINYRPVLEDGMLEASYPSSHTMLSICVFGSAMMQIRARIMEGRPRQIAQAIAVILMLLIIVGRLLSGVHWLTDMIGSVLISAALLTLYAGLLEWRKKY